MCIRGRRDGLLLADHQSEVLHGQELAVPVLLDLDAEVQLDPLAQEMDEVLAGDILDGRDEFTALADDHALLGVLGDVDADHGADPFGGLGDVVRDDGRRIGEFVLQAVEQLFTHGVRNDEFDWVGRQRLVVEIGLTDRHCVDGRLHQRCDACASRRRNVEDGRRMELLHEGSSHHLMALGRVQVHLVDDEEDRLAKLDDDGNHLLVLGVGIGRLVDDEIDDLDVLQRLKCRVDKVCVELALAHLVITRRVDETDLGVLFVEDAKNVVPGGLLFG